MKASSNNVCFHLADECFTETLMIISQVAAETQSGNIVFNDTFQQLAGKFVWIDSMSAHPILSASE
jgi:hypothetical protein